MNSLLENSKLLRKCAVRSASEALDSEAQARWLRAEARREDAMQARQAGNDDAAGFYRRQADTEDRIALELQEHADALRIALRRDYPDVPGPAPTEAEIDAEVWPDGRPTFGAGR